MAGIRRLRRWVGKTGQVQLPVTGLRNRHEGTNDVNFMNDESAAQQAERSVMQANGIDADDGRAGVVAYNQTGNPRSAQQGTFQRANFQGTVHSTGKALGSGLDEPRADGRDYGAHNRRSGDDQYENEKQKPNAGTRNPKNSAPHVDFSSACFGTAGHTEPAGRPRRPGGCSIRFGQTAHQNGGQR